MKQMIIIELMKGVEGFALYIDGLRICGPKPWGGGTVIKTWEVDKEDLKEEGISYFD